jgi:hypothetical protein
MASTTEVHDVISAIKRGQLSLADLKGLVGHPSALVRANAIVGLATQESDVDELIGDLTLAASREENSICLMGTTSVADIAIGELVRLGHEKALRAARRLVETWPESQRADLNRYLNSERLSFG